MIFTSGNDGAFTVAAGWLVDDDGLVHARMIRWMDDDGPDGGTAIGAASLGAVAGRSTVPLARTCRVMGSGGCGWNGTEGGPSVPV